MHKQAYDWVKRFATPAAIDVLDIGGRNINGSVRELYPGAVRYVAVDLHDGPGVDVVADVTTWDEPGTFDVVVCCEVLEHAPNWREIVRTAHDRLKPGGQFVMTCAGPGRAPHSGVDGGWKLHPGEHYGNVSERELEEVLAQTGWATFTTDVAGEDTRCVAVRW
jgi:SAM-dependent methyltransferase